MADDVLRKRLQAMVGFRNISVHDYQGINLTIVKDILEKHLVDFREFARCLVMEKA